MEYNIYNLGDDTQLGDSILFVKSLRYYFTRAEIHIVHSMTRQMAKNVVRTLLHYRKKKLIATNDILINSALE